MPVERVYESPQSPFGPIDGPGVSIVEVHWDRETENVQVVTKAMNRFTHDRLTDDPGIHYTDGLWVTLDRHGINRLIKQLRRARDQVFGRDE